MLPLSSKWTLQLFFNQARSEARNIDPVAYAQRFELSALAQNAIAGLFFPVMASAYQTPVICTVNTGGKHLSTTAVWDPVTNSIVGTMTSSFDATDVDKIVVFRSGTLYYVGYISSWVSATTVRVIGNNLPTDTLALDEVIMVNTASADEVVSLATLDPPMMRTGEQSRIILHSSVTTNIAAITPDELAIFNPSREKTKLAWSLIGSQIRMRRGKLLASEGTLAIDYPRVPIAPKDDLDYMDLPDGPAITIALAWLTTKLLPIAVRVKEGPIRLMSQDIAGLYRQFGVTAQKEDIKQKLEALA